MPIETKIEMEESNSSNDTSDRLQKQISLPNYCSLILRQIYSLRELKQHGQPSEIIRHYQDINSPTLRRDLKKLSDVLHIDEFYTKSGTEFRLTKEAELILDAFEPAFRLLDRLVKRKYVGRKIIKIGSGGSLLGWLVGQRLDQIRQACGERLSKDSEIKTRVHLECTPLQNRQIVSHICSRALDFGLVRKSLVDVLPHAASTQIASKEIGTVTYGLIIPEEILGKYGLPRGSENEMAKWEETILSTENLATVWPEGEFKMQLQWAFRDRIENPHVEFSYRSFPQTIPHLLAGTHVVLAPFLPIFGVEIPGCRAFPLNLLKNYDRPICLIWNKKLSPDYIDTEALGRALEFNKR